MCCFIFTETAETLQPEHLGVKKICMFNKQQKKTWRPTIMMVVDRLVFFFGMMMVVIGML